MLIENAMWLSVAIEDDLHAERDSGLDDFQYYEPDYSCNCGSNRSRMERKWDIRQELTVWKSVDNYTFDYYSFRGYMLTMNIALLIVIYCFKSLSQSADRP